MKKKHEPAKVFTWDQFQLAKPKQAEAFKKWYEKWKTEEGPSPEDIIPLEKWTFYDNGNEGGLAANDNDSKQDIVYFPTLRKWEPD